MNTFNRTMRISLTKQWYMEVEAKISCPRKKNEKKAKKDRCLSSVDFNL